MAACVRTAPIRAPYSSEHLDSSTCAASEATVTTAERHALPESDERSSCVSVDSRYGTYSWPAAMARTHLPSAEREVLMATAWRSVEAQRGEEARRWMVESGGA